MRPRSSGSPTAERQQIFRCPREASHASRQGRNACDRTLTGGIEVTITGACAQAPLFAARPGARPAALVYERDDPQLHPLDNTENEIGKASQRKAPHHPAPRRSKVWSLAQDLEGTLEFGYEREP